MTRLVVISSLALLLLSAVACSRKGQNAATPSPEPPKITSESVVKVTVEPMEVAAGQSNEAVVKVNTQSGYHINANPASFEYLKATEVDLPDTPELFVDYIYYPNPQVKKFSFSPDAALRVYEGETQLRIMLNADKAAPKGPRTLPAKLNVQACDDKVCYPPASVPFSIPVTIK
ncbi:MAG TPA: protein-disulfide reductase DsbD domain-containing protein [Pyrinomonadaceae bacterium]|nr:protein-disulfide reductase DsbD domain-containing protein [Pyrinomonadaceae bacterium]